MIHELVIAVAMHLLKGLVPAGPCFGRRPNEQLSLLNNEFDRSMQLTLLNDGFWNSDPLRISDAHDVGLHLSLLTLIIYIQCNYTVRMRVVNQGLTRWPSF